MLQLFRRVPLPLLNACIELAPLIAFFVSYHVGGRNFYLAVLVMVLVTPLSVALALGIERRIAWFPLIGMVSIIGFGGSTLWFKMPDIFIIQDTLQFVSFAGALLLSVRWRRTILEHFFGATFALSPRGWRTLTVRWAILFILLALMNEAVRFAADDATWVLYKLISTIGIGCFGLWQFRLAHRERLLHESNSWGLRVRHNRAGETSR